jgi:hypothetical protein
VPKPGEEGWLESFDSDLTAVTAIWRGPAFRVHDPVGGEFDCPLHRALNCVGRLEPTQGSGHWVFYCSNLPKGTPVARVRALLARRDGRLSATELATWKLRAVVEAGLQPPVDVGAAPLMHAVLELVGRNADNLRRVWDGFVLLLECRWITHPGQPVTFTRDFAGPWCDTSPDQRARRSASFARSDFWCRPGRHTSAATTPTCGYRRQATAHVAQTMARRRRWPFSGPDSTGARDRHHA